MFSSAAINRIVTRSPYGPQGRNRDKNTMIRAVVEDLAAIVSLALFLACIATWAAILG